MAFFAPEKLKRKIIVVDDSAISCDSAEVKVRLDRIEDNYTKLDSILAELELKMASDDRLKAIDESNADDFEQTFGIRRKRKWKPAKKKSKKAKVKAKTKVSAKAKSNRRSTVANSVDPRKPR